MADVFATSFAVPNYSGLLFNNGYILTPLSTLIGGKAKITNHVEFVTGQEYNSVSNAAQPGISEIASLAAPDAKVITRTQSTNVTQIFHYATGISYGKMSNMGTLSGINIANQQANPQDEFSFQVNAMLDQARADIEYTFINGTYVRSTSDNTANKTRGLIEAITSNVIDCDNKPLSFWTVVEGVKSVEESNGNPEGLVLLCDANTILQLNSDASSNGLTVINAAREVNGIKLNTIITPFGTVHMLADRYVPAGTAILANIDTLYPVHQNVPEKGNFFVEELATVGAGKKYQMFGQIGLDHGPEWYHAKFTGISTTFTAPDGTKRVEVVNSESKPVNTKAIT